MKEKTIEDTTKNGLCTGCGTCAAMCPNGAINMIIDQKKGIFLPNLNYDLCSLCGRCLEVCPGISVDFLKIKRNIDIESPYNGTSDCYREICGSCSKNKQIRECASSGGFVTQLLLFAIKEKIINGAIVVRMKRDNPFEPEPFIARTCEDIIEASQSKFCPVPVNSVLRDIISARKNERYAIVGLPCHIHGIRKAELISKELREKVILHIGLFCNSCIPSFLATEFFLQKYGVRSEKVSRINYRMGLFPPGDMIIELNNNESLKISHIDFWNSVFHPLSTLFAPRRCLLCPDSTNELADISVGSDWNRKNSSLVIIRSKSSQQLVQKCKEIKFINIDPRVSKYNNKKLNQKALANLFDIIGWQKPKYNMINVSNPKIENYAHCITLYLRHLASSNRGSWSYQILVQSIVAKAAEIRKLANTNNKKF